MEQRRAVQVTRRAGVQIPVDTEQELWVACSNRLHREREERPGKAADSLMGFF